MCAVQRLPESSGNLHCDHWRGQTGAAESYLSPATRCTTTLWGRREVTAETEEVGGVGAQKCWEVHPEGVKCRLLLALAQRSSMKGCFSARGSRSHHSNGAIHGSDQNHKNDRTLSSPLWIKCTEPEWTRGTRETTTDSSYLINCNIVTRLLKARGVVVPVPHDYPHLVENNSADQLVGALDLHHDGHDVVRGLKERSDKRSS